MTYLPRLVAAIRRADVVHAFAASYASFLLAPFPALLVARALGKPAILNYRSGEARDHLNRSSVARRAAAAADLTVVPSRFLVEVFADFAVSAEAIPNIVDLERFSFRERAPLRPRLLSTRNFERLYDVACTIRAFHIVQQRWPQASLTLVGGGTEEAALRQLVSRLSLRHVSFAGRVAPNRIADY